MKYKFSMRMFCYPLLLAVLAVQCKKGNSETPGPEPEPVAEATTASVDRSTKFQTIDGFGFFGARNVWWEDASELYTQAWGEQVINDLGITIWRTELFPPETPNAPQDASFEKQVTTITGLKDVAAASNVPLKFIFTVWSPPAQFKCALDDDNNLLSGTPHPGETKEGGSLDPIHYADYGNWLADGIQQFKDLGVNVYAFSPQNEPLFKQFFNSCYYRPTDQYPDMIRAVIPVVKARFPDVKVFGSENMLEMEGGKDRQYFYNAALMKDATALNLIDMHAVHGYSDGIAPTGTSKLAELWNTTRDEHAAVSGKPYWMTETSGYGENWTRNSSNQSGAFNLAMDIYSALVYGNVAAWVWWQGSESDALGEEVLMRATDVKGKKYNVSKHFYRFIRPGAVRTKIATDESQGIFGAAFEQAAMGSFTVVLINSSDKPRNLKLEGDNIPDLFDYYVTTSSSTVNCQKAAAQVSKTAIELPAQSIVTLVNGNVFE